MLKRLSLTPKAFRTRSVGSASPTSPVATHEWRVPPEILYRIIDNHLSKEKSTLKALSSSCRALREYCQKLIFRDIWIGESPPLLQPFAALLKRSPAIAGYVQTLAILDIPQPSKALKLAGIASSDEKALNFILKQRFPSLESMQIRDKSCALVDLSLDAQSSLHAFFQINGPKRVSLQLDVIPSTLLDSCRNVQSLDLCGQVIVPPKSRRASSEGDYQAQPQSLRVCCLPPDSLALLADTGGRFSLAGLRELKLPVPSNLSSSIGKLVRTCADTLAFLWLIPSTWHDAVPLPLGTFTSLQALRIVAFGEPSELRAALGWLSSSLAIKPSPEPGLLEELHVVMETRKDSQPATNASDEVYEQHARIWGEVSKQQDHWPNLKTVDIRGFSSTREVKDKTMYVTLSCLGLFKHGGHPKDEHDHGHDHHHAHN